MINKFKFNNYINNRVFFMFILCLYIFNVQHVHAKDVIDTTTNCSINWTTGTIICSGESEVDQTKFKAKRAATIIAQRNLLEVVKGIHVDSTKTVKDGMLQHDRIKTSVEGVIKGAEIVSNVYNQQEKSAICTLKLRMGEDLLKALLNNSQDLAWKSSLEKLFSVFATKLNADENIDVKDNDTFHKLFGYEDRSTLIKLKKLLLEQEDNEAFIDQIDQIIHYIGSEKKYTGILIDASRVQDFQKAMLAKLVNKKGEELYPSTMVSKRILIKNNGSVSYELDKNDAINNKRIATAPVIIPALSVYKNRKSDLVIDDESIVKLRKLFHGLLKNAKIIVLIGE